MPGDDAHAPAGRVVIAGASGFIGARLTAAYRERGWQVDRIGRHDAVRWGDTEAITGLVDGADLLITLAGKSRWVVPARLEAAGFRFEHPHLEEALRSILAPSH